jgi:hypothetical protein
MKRDHVPTYRERAQQCREMAELAEDPEDIEFWRNAEQRWLTLADQVEQAADLFDSLDLPYKPKPKP